MATGQIDLPQVAEQMEKRDALAPIAMLTAAFEKNMGPEALKVAYEIYKDAKASHAKECFELAINRFKTNPPKVTKNRHVKYSTSKGEVDYWHSTIDNVCAILAPPLSAVGISFRWKTGITDGLISVSCVLTHKEGHSEETTLQGLPDETGGKNKIQAVGSTTTYLQRYTLLLACGLATQQKDDDGAGGTLDDVDGRLKEILKATPETLIKVFKYHHEEATKAQDGVAMLKITNAKDQRREELGI